MPIFLAIMSFTCLMRILTYFLITYAIEHSMGHTGHPAVKRCPLCHSKPSVKSQTSFTPLFPRTGPLAAQRMDSTNQLFSNLFAAIRKCQSLQRIFFCMVRLSMSYETTTSNNYVCSSDCLSRLSCRRKRCFVQLLCISRFHASALQF